MIVRRTVSPNAARSRSAFTLLEVLVVVAILIVLASVAGIYVFGYLEDAKKDKATLDMQALTTAYESYMLKNGNNPPEGLQALIPLMKQGEAALIDPWGNPYQYREVTTETGQFRVQFFTFAEGQEIAWPRQ